MTVTMFDLNDKINAEVERRRCDTQIFFAWTACMPLLMLSDISLFTISKKVQ
jgi:hypothetical protein